MAEDLRRVDEVVRIAFDDKTIRIVTQYEISTRFFTQPSAFSVTIGSPQITQDLIKLARPGTPFVLYIGETPQMSGLVDGYIVSGSGGSQLTVRGRDYLAKLHDETCGADTPFSNLTYEQLVLRVLDLAGIEEFSLVGSNESNRRVVSDTIITELQPQNTNVGALAATTAAAAVAAAAGAAQVASAATGAAAGAAGAKVLIPTVVDIKKQVIKVKVGDTWYSFLKRELDRAGLFLRCGAEPRSYILAPPQGNQAPAFRICRRRFSNRDTVNVVGHPRFRNETTKRHGAYIVHGRGGGGKDGRAKVVGTYEDAEMLAWGLDKERHIVDTDVKSTAQAAYLAQRYCAEARRNGFELSYVVAGHRTPVIGGGNTKYGVWAPDVVVDVNDDEFGIYEPMWIEGVTFRGGGNQGTTTELTLVRPADLIFGDPFASPKQASKRRKRGS